MRPGDLLKLKELAIAASSGGARIVAKTTEKVAIELSGGLVLIDGEIKDLDREEDLVDPEVVQSIEDAFG